MKRKKRNKNKNIWAVSSTYKQYTKKARRAKEKRALRDLNRGIDKPFPKFKNSDAYDFW